MGTKTVRCRHMMLAQQIQHLPAGIQTKEDLAELIKQKLNPERYAIIVHDKDLNKQGQPEEPGIHAMLTFKHPRAITAVAKKLGIPPQYIEKWDGEANNGYAYLVHATDKARKGGKYQYDPSEVAANFDYAALLKKITTDVAQVRAEHGVNVKALLDSLYAGAITKEEIEKQLPGSLYARYHRQIDDVDAKRLQNEAEKWREEMRKKNAKVQVIWLTGPGGTGKSSFAKDIARKRGQPYFISGSTRDIFQGYNGEHTLILDELRPGVLTYADLLRITDPFGFEERVMAPCRYNDKALACDLIIVTTPFTPALFYHRQFSGNTLPTPGKKDCADGMFQLLRRISVTIEMTGKQMEVTEYSFRGDMFVPIPGTARPNPYSRLARPASEDDPVEVYNSILSAVEN